MRCRYPHETARTFEAGLLGPSSDGVRVYLEKVDNAITSLGNDVLQAVASAKVLSARFLADWNLFVIGWRAYYVKHHDAWDAGLARTLGGSEIVSEVSTYEKELSGYRQRFSEETQLSPTMKDAELPGPPTPTVGGPGNGPGDFLSGLTTPVVAISVLAAIVIFGPSLSRRL